MELIQVALLTPYSITAVFIYRMIKKRKEKAISIKSLLVWILLPELALIHKLIGWLRSR